MHIVDELRIEIQELKQKLAKRKRNHALMQIPTYFALVSSVFCLIEWLVGWYFLLFQFGMFIIVWLPILIYGIIVLIIFVIRIKNLKETIRSKEKEYKKLALKFSKNNSFTTTTTKQQPQHYIKCAYCGYETPDQFKKCSHCGAVL